MPLHPVSPFIFERMDDNEREKQYRVIRRSTGQTLGYVTEWHGGRWWYSGADWERDDLPDTRAAAARALLRQHGSPRHRRRRRS